MNFIRRFLIVCALGLLGAYAGFLLSKKQTDEAKITGTGTKLDTMNISAIVPTGIEPASTEGAFPEDAIPNERVVHFVDQEDYLNYLKALSEAGLVPLGQIDSLSVVRVGKDVLAVLNPASYGGRSNFSYKVERPLPPTEIDPEVYAQLHAFGESARAIVGDSFEGDGSGVVVAVLDSGIEAHPYFDDLQLTSIDLTSKGISSLGAGHGTAVASIIGGKEGIVPAAELLVVRVLDDQGVGSSFDVSEGIIRAVDQGAHIINLSLGVYQDTQVLREAVRYAQSNGVLLVAAVGNDGYAQLPYPAAYPQVLSVTAVDGKGRQALFPNKSKAIDVAAPGVGILAASEEEGTELFSGTSAAAPFVTGTLAALLSADDPLHPQEAVNALKRYLDDAGAAGTDSTYGGGLVNWDRLRERATTDVVDVALADIYLQSDAQPGTTMPIEVTVQNQGTAWLTTAELEVLIEGAEPIEFTIGALAPGHITTRRVHTYVPSMQSAESLQIAARVLAENDSEDVRPKNNAKAVFFKPIQR